MPQGKNGKRSRGSKNQQGRRLRDAKRYIRLANQAESIEMSLPAIDAAIRQNPRLLGPALAAPFKVSSLAIAEDHERLPGSAWCHLALIPLADHVLSRAGAGWPNLKDLTAATSWLSTLRWGLDHYVYIAHSVRGGLLLGAALSTRMFLERWTLNVAHHHGILRGPDESDAAFMTRAWNVYPHIDGNRDVGLYWRWLSEYLHGRPELEGAFESADAAGTTADKIIAIANIALDQVLGGVRVVGEEYGMTALTSTLFKSPVETNGHGYHPQSEAIAMCLHQLDFEFTMSEPASSLVAEGRKYRQTIGDRNLARHLKTTFSFPLGEKAFIERRGRAIETARAAFRIEMKMLGNAFDPPYLASRLFRYITISQMADVVAESLQGPESLALRRASEALGSAWRAWLDDSDLTLGCLRVILEQTARARAHRLKQNRSEKLESLATAPAPSRWMELAGFRRLAAYNRALGEFAHIRTNTRQSGARQLLVEMQTPNTPNPNQTARGQALDEATYLLAHEIALRLDQHFPRVATEFRRRVTLTNSVDHEKLVADLLDRVLGLRDHDFGEPDFVPTR